MKITNEETIGLISPSAPLPGIFPDRFKRGVSALKDMGYNVICGDYVTNIGTNKIDRANDLNQMFENPDVDIVLATIGGETASDILPYINWTSIEKSKKRFIGYSDISVLLNAVGIKGKQVVYYGPTLMTEIAEYPVPPLRSTKDFMSALDSSELFVVQPTEYLFAEGTDWALPPTERDEKVDVIQKTIRGGIAEGTVLGGCIEALERIRGTEYWPDFTGAIFVVETVEREFNEDNWNKFITDYLNMHVLDKISGLIIGQKMWGDESLSKLADMFLKIEEMHNIPILYGLPFGHISPISTIPMFTSAVLDANKKTLSYKKPYVYSYKTRN